MAVIKTYDAMFGHVWDGEQPEMSVEDAIEVIKSRKENPYLGEVDYIGERHVVDFEPEKLDCKNCKELALAHLGRERK